MNKTTYWKRESINDGSIIALFKIETSDKGMEGFIYKKGKWEEHETICARAGYDDDYDYTTEAQAKSIIKMTSFRSMLL